MKSVGALKLLRQRSNFLGHTLIITFLVLAVPVVVFFFLVFFLPSLPALVLLELEEDPAFVVAVVEHLGKSLSTEASMEDSVED